MTWIGWGAWRSAPCCWPTAAAPPRCPRPSSAAGCLATTSKPWSAPVASYFAAVWAIVRKDLAAEWRSRQMVTAMLVFVVLVIFIFAFTLDIDMLTRRQIAAGVLWTTFAFAGILGLNRTLATEGERGSLDGLLLAPVERSAIYFGKTLANLFFMLVVEIFTLPLYALFYNMSLAQPGLWLVLLLGSWCFCSVGTLLAAMAAQARSRELLLPVLLLPMALPVLVASVRASSAFVNGLGMEYASASLNILVVYGLIMPALGFMFFDFIVEE
ncbi:MAG: heme exporter protein CcmB [Anaerolineales bacterium]|nr:heme exporter protein CcmB [Anaerolineales bacterium]